MSFVCDLCGVTQPHGTPSTRIVVKTREKAYPFRKDANKDGNDDPGGKGTEIAMEATVCVGCDK